MALKTVAQLNNAGNLYEVRVDDDVLVNDSTITVVVENVHFGFDDEGRLREATINFGRVVYEEE